MVNTFDNFVSRPIPSMDETKKLPKEDGKTEEERKKGLHRPRHETASLATLKATLDKCCKQVKYIV